MSRFVRPAIVRIKLSDGDFIDVKKTLNVGELRRIFARMSRDMTPGEKVTLDPEQVGLAKVVEYLVGWSFIDDDGKPVELPQAPDAKAAVLANLHPDSFTEIREAIDAHEAAMDAVRDKEKNDPGRESNSNATSPSPSAAAGV